MSQSRETSDKTEYRKETSLGAALAGRFVVGDEIGRGGSGVVYRGHRVADGTPVAIKVLRPELAGAILTERFLREIVIESRLSHPNIMAVLESGSAADLPYLVLPLAAQGSLRTRLEGDHELPLHEALAITRDVAAALAFAHGQGIVHRDVKPENILLTGGRAYLADFGIARVLGTLGGERITESGIALGTPAYMSPEQAASARVLDGRSDLYSLACVFYEMLTGDPPFPGRSSRAVLARHASETPHSVRAIRPAIPAAVEYAVLRALEKSPADRFSSVDEFLRALDTPPPAGWVAQGEVASATAAHSRRRWLAGLAVVTMVGIAWTIVGKRDPAPDANKVMLFPLVDASPTVGTTNPGWSVAWAIGRSLERALPLRGLDGWSYLDASTQADVRLLTSRDARRLARSRGARYYVTGAIAHAGDSTGVTLRLYDASSDSLVAQETGVGAADEPSVMKSGLHAAALLLPRLLDPGRTIDVRFLADRNKSALALWIQGEQAYRRAEFERALGFFQRALAEDSLFAVAALRGAQAASWQSDEGLAAKLVAVAVANDSLLPQGSAALARGFSAYLAGDADSSVHWLKIALRQMPDAAEAPMLLGEAYHHLVREADDSAKIQFREAAARDTAFTPPFVHLAEMAIRAGDVGAGGRFIERLRVAKSDSTTIRRLELMRDCVRKGNTDWTAAAQSNLDAVVVASHDLAVAGSQPQCAEGAFRAALSASKESDAYRWHSLLGLQGLLVSEGRGEEVRTLLDAELAAGRRIAMLLYPLDALVGAPTAAKRAENEAYLRQRYGDTYEKAPVLTRWMLAVGYTQDRDGAMVERIAASVQHVADSTHDPRDRRIAAVVAAHAALARGDTTTALARFRALRPAAPPAVLLSNVFESLAVERLVLARLLLARGEFRETMKVASTFDHPEPIMNLPFLAESLRIREEAATKSAYPQVANEMRARLRALRAAGESRRR